MGNPLVRHPGEGEKYRALGDLVTVLVSAAETAGAYEVLLVEGQGRDTSPPHHRHPWSEAVWVLQGRVELWLGGQILQLEAGAFAFCPSHVSHSLRLLGGDARWLVVSSHGQHSRWVDWLDREAPFDLSPHNAAAIAQQFGVELETPKP
jgi:quercetin dioxygenase-like cupin family protein